MGIQKRFFFKKVILSLFALLGGFGGFVWVFFLESTRVILEIITVIHSLSLQIIRYQINFYNVSHIIVCKVELL